MKFRIIRGRKVITDADLAEAVGMTSKAFIAFCKRNSAAFGEGSILTLTEEERRDLVQNYCFTHAERLRYAKRLPWIFTAPAVIQALCMRARSSAAAKELKDKFFAAICGNIDLEQILK
ncbi:MAG: ORF6N domain-containing protein [Elusimicrobiota bacterium]|nr:ORF6N domain-containing protein [Elusimicrobiota bacterium]